MRDELNLRELGAIFDRSTIDVVRFGGSANEQESRALNTYMHERRQDPSAHTNLIRLLPPHDPKACDWCRDTAELRRLTRANRILYRLLVGGGTVLFGYCLFRLLFS